MSKYLILVFPLLFTLNYPGATWDKIENRTWISATDGVFGAQMVFLKDAEGQKAINQWAGSGCCHILTHVYAVEISNDTIVLEPLPTNTIEDYGTADTPETIKFIISENDSVLQKVGSAAKYTIYRSEVMLYKGCCNILDNKPLIQDTITSTCFNGQN